MPAVDRPRAGGEPPFATVAEWLTWLERCNPREIHLGTERVVEVLARMPLASPAPLTLTVGGTNGKGSCVAYLSAMLAALDRRCGTYTSPHLHRFNERIAVSGTALDDATLLDAFAAVERAREGVALTYFEFTTLAALAAFDAAGCDARVLEVGLGGRLDAVNAVDADGALLVSVALDHVDWLGSDRESIGGEKAGIFRAGRPAVCADPDPPASVFTHARRIGARLLRPGHDYDHGRDVDGWWYRSAGLALHALPAPGLGDSDVQRGNAAASLALLEACAGADAARVAAPALARARLPARGERIERDGVTWIVDVAHNPAAAAALAAALGTVPAGRRRHAVFGILDTKDVSGVLAALAPRVDAWYLAPADAPRAVAAPALRAALPEDARARVAGEYASVAAACDAAAAAAAAGDEVVVFGSFHIAGPALEHLQLS